MEKTYEIQGLDCANCAAKLERRLKEISYFRNVIIDFMAQKLILTIDTEEDLAAGLIEVQKVIQQVEPGVTLHEKGRQRKTMIGQKQKKHDHAHMHGSSCSSGHIHDNSCSCEHNHAHSHTHDNSCSCEHGHVHNHSGSQPIQQADVCETISETKIQQRQESNSFTAEMKRSLLKIAISAVLFTAAVFVSEEGMLSFGLYAVAYLLVGGEVLLRAVKNIARGQVFDENFLMSVATIGAFGVGEYPEGVMVMLLYQLGELFQDYAVHRSRRSIAELMDIKPEVAHVKRGDDFVTVEPEAVAIGDMIQIRPGEKVPLDGVVLEGHSALDTTALTGESVPRELAAGEQVLSGCINLSGLLMVRVEKEYEDSTVVKILDLVENASSKKAEAENFITRFARYYTPVVVCIAAFLALVPPLLTGDAFDSWIYRALVFLVISCPCALVISIPLTFFGGLGACSRHGILVKGSNYLEALAQVETAVFDKTGTLTKGQFAVTEIHPIGISQDELLYYTACAESISNHPVARAVQQVSQSFGIIQKPEQAEEIAGYGISAVVDGHLVLVGNYRLMERERIACSRVQETGTIVYVAVDGICCGWLMIADEMKADAKPMVQHLKDLGVKQIVMLTGDNQQTAERVAGQLGITKVFSQLLPGDKVQCLEQLLQQKSQQGTVAFTGDGINDAPVLARADVGIAMGGFGSDAAIEAADVVIMDDQPDKLSEAIRIARQTRRIVKQNIIFILAVKFLVLILGAVGLASMWMAVFADVGVAVLAILNAVRIIRK